MGLRAKRTPPPINKAWEGSGRCERKGCVQERYAAFRGLSGASHCPPPRECGCAGPALLKRAAPGTWPQFWSHTVECKLMSTDAVRMGGGGEGHRSASTRKRMFCRPPKGWLHGNPGLGLEALDKSGDGNDCQRDTCAQWDMRTGSKRSTGGCSCGDSYVSRAIAHAIFLTDMNRTRCQ